MNIDTGVSAGQVSVHKSDGQVVWESVSDPQAAAVTANEDIVCLTGGRGGGRTTAMIMRPLVNKSVNYRGFRGLLVCPSDGCVRNLMQYAGDRYAPFGSRVLPSSKRIIFPSGATVEFCSIEDDERVECQARSDHHFLGVDNIDGFGDPDKGSPDKENFFRLVGSVRSKANEPKDQIFVVATPCELKWVYDFFIRGMEHGVPKQVGGITKLMLKFSLGENPYLAEGDRYRRILTMMPPKQQEKWLHGEWPHTD